MKIKALEDSNKMDGWTRTLVRGLQYNTTLSRDLGKMKINLLLCGAFSLINSLAHSLPRNVAILNFIAHLLFQRNISYLHNWCSANLNCFIVGQWLEADMAHLGQSGHFA